MIQPYLGSGSSWDAVPASNENLIFGMFELPFSGIGNRFPVLLFFGICSPSSDKSEVESFGDKKTESV